MKRYNDLSSHLKQQLGCKTFKVSLDIGATCPNLDGALAKKGCTFCNDAAFSPTLAQRRNKTITEQLEHGMAYVRKRHQNAQAIGYFQSFTSTYGDFDLLKKKFLEAAAHPAVMGIALSTRPDCLDTRWCEFFATLAQKKYFWIELGLQSSNHESLMAMNRWHTPEQFVQAIWLLKKYGLHVCSHLLLGLPGETAQQMIQTTQFLGSLPIDGIKFHNLHVVKGTQLADRWRAGQYQPLTLETYADITVRCLELLAPRIVVHRLNAHAPRHLTLAPDWSINKLGVLNAVEQRLLEQNTWQGKTLGFDLRIL